MNDILVRMAEAPIEAWIALGLMLWLVAEALLKWDADWAKPAVVIYSTIGTWYLGDFLLSEDADYSARFAPEVIGLGFAQITVFLLSFRLIVTFVVKRLVQHLPDAEQTVEFPQRLVLQGLLAAMGIWLVLFCIAVERNEGVLAPLLWPPAAPEKVGMFVHSGLGTGNEFLVAAAGYIHVLVCALFGVFFVLAKGQAKWLALLMIGLSWPYFWFDRARNVMLAMLLPAVACYLLVGRGSMPRKAAFCVVLLAGVNMWFLRVMDYRATGGDMQVFADGPAGDLEGKHYGLDMMKELCWINSFIQAGIYEPNHGQRYFAEIANIVPRAIWPNKPMIGIDYAIARGFGGGDFGAGVIATVSTGIIGQGVVNFGPYVGPVVPALLMALWTGLLVKFWRQRSRLPRLCLFLLGIGLTFNMGRDITLLVLFPFVFAALGVFVYEQFRPAQDMDQESEWRLNPRQW